MSNHRRREAMDVAPDDESGSAGTAGSATDMATQHQLPSSSERATTADDKEAGTHIDFTPHHHTVTRAGFDQYHDTALVQHTVCAIAEFVDNSLTAVSKQDTKKIEVVTVKSPSNAMIAVLDTGVGMDEKGISDFARFHHTTELRVTVDNEYPNPRVKHHRYINSGISHFGVGAKQAAFYLGTQVEVYTKQKGAAHVLHFKMSQEEFERLDSSSENPYQGRVRTLRAHPSSLPDAIAAKSGIATAVSPEASFTCIVISELQGHSQHLLEEPLAVRQQLANLYHYYIHGITGNAAGLSGKMQQRIHPAFAKAWKLREHMCVALSVLRIVESSHGIDAEAFDLSDVDNDYESRCLQAADDVFNFDLDVRRASDGSHFMFQGQLRYHGYKGNAETRPSREDTGQIPASGEQKKAGDIFNIFWNGRLIPGAALESLPFCSEFDRYRKRKSPKAKKSLPGAVADKRMLSRMTGTLWTGLPATVNQSKEHLTKPDLATILAQQGVTVQLRRDKDKSRDIDDWEGFTKWLAACSRFDETCTFSQPLKAEFHGKSKYYVFQHLKLPGAVIKGGDPVLSKKRGERVAGKVLRFLIDSNEDIKTKEQYVLEPDARAFVLVKREPQEYFTDPLWIDIARIHDLEVVKKSALSKKIAALRKQLPHRIYCVYFIGEKEVDPNSPISLDDIKRGGGLNIKVVFVSMEGHVLEDKSVYKGTKIQAVQDAKALGDQDFKAVTTDVVPPWAADGNCFWIKAQPHEPCVHRIVISSGCVKTAYQKELQFVAGRISRVQVDTEDKGIISLPGPLRVRCTFTDENNNKCLVPDNEDVLLQYLPEAEGDEVTGMTFFKDEHEEEVVLEIELGGSARPKGTRRRIDLNFHHEDLAVSLQVQCTVYPGPARKLMLDPSAIPPFINKAPLPKLPFQLKDQWNNPCKLSKGKTVPLLVVVQNSPEPIYTVHLNERMEVVDGEPIVYRSVLREQMQVPVMVCLVDADEMAKIPKSRRRAIEHVVSRASIVGSETRFEATVLPGSDPCVVRLQHGDELKDVSGDAREGDKNGVLDVNGRVGSLVGDIGVNVLTEGGEIVPLSKVPNFKVTHGPKDVTRYVLEKGKLPRMHLPSSAPAEEYHTFTFTLERTVVAVYVRCKSELGALAGLMIKHAPQQLHLGIPVHKKLAIVVCGQDEDENTVPLQPDDIVVEGACIDARKLTKTVTKKHELFIYNFVLTGSPGVQQLFIKHAQENMHTTHSLQVLPGYPFSFVAEEEEDDGAELNPADEVEVQTGAELFSLLRVTVVDEHRYPCNYLQGGRLKLRCKSKHIKLSAQPGLEAQVRDGVAVFKEVFVTGNPGKAELSFTLRTSKAPIGASVTSFNLNKTIRLRVTENTNTPRRIEFPTAQSAGQLPPVMAGSQVEFPFRVLNLEGEPLPPVNLHQHGFLVKTRAKTATGPLRLDCNHDDQQFVATAPAPLEVAGALDILVTVQHEEGQPVVGKASQAVQPGPAEQITTGSAVEPVTEVSLKPASAERQTLFANVAFHLMDKYSNPVQGGGSCALSLVHPQTGAELEVSPATVPFATPVQVRAAARTAFAPGAYVFTARAQTVQGVLYQRSITVLDAQKDKEVLVRQRQQKQQIVGKLAEQYKAERDKYEELRRQFTLFRQLHQLENDIERELQRRLPSDSRSHLRAQHVLEDPRRCDELIRERRRGSQHDDKVPRLRQRDRARDVHGYVAELLEADDRIVQRIVSNAVPGYLSAVVCDSKTTAKQLGKHYRVRDLDPLPQERFRQDTPANVRSFGGRSLAEFVRPTIEHKKLNALLNRMLSGLFVFDSVDRALAFRDSGARFRALFTRDEANMQRIDSLGFFGGGGLKTFDQLKYHVGRRDTQRDERNALEAVRPLCSSYFDTRRAVDALRKSESEITRDLKAQEHALGSLKAQLTTIQGPARVPADPRLRARQPQPPPPPFNPHYAMQQQQQQAQAHPQQHPQSANPPKRHKR